MIEPLALPDIDDEPPAGPNLENDPDFRDMLQAAKGKADSQFGEGEPPDWREVVRLGTALLARTRDLRVLVQLAIARLNLEDLPGFASVLMATRQVLESGWAEVHPQLDPEDDNDPIMRANALTDLSNGRVTRALRVATLVAPPREARVRWLDVEVATGAMEPEAGQARLTDAEIRGAFQKAGLERLTALREAGQAIVAELAAIPRAFDAQAGGNDGPDFKELPKVAHGLAAELARQEAMAAETPSDDVAAEEPGAEGAAPQGAGGAGAGGAAPAGRSFTSIRNIASLSSRADALHALTLASEYFRNNEPSSPLPLLIDRATRLAPLPFMEVLRDLAPDGLIQAQIVAGQQETG